LILVSTRVVEGTSDVGSFETCPPPKLPERISKGIIKAIITAE
jgi:hypothetical protein